VETVYASALMPTEQSKKVDRHFNNLGTCINLLNSCKYVWFFLTEESKSIRAFAVLAWS